MDNYSFQNTSQSTSFNESNFNNSHRFVSELPPIYQSVFSEFQMFNSIQSHLMDDLLLDDSSIVVSAPTGSGKTTLFELAIIRLLECSQSDKSSVVNHKIVYMAPVKALCSERYMDWEQKFLRLGLKAIEVTGDSDEGNLLAIQHFNLVLTTPEKWDSLTRKWRDHTSLISVIKLFLIDEVHLLNEDRRGSTLEAVVSRMKTVQESGSCLSKIRFIAVSATIPNIEDIAVWLGNKSKPAKYFRFGEETRPVKLRQIVKTYPFSQGMSYFKFDFNMSYKLKQIILDYSEGKPTLIFCSTRKSVLQTSGILLQNITFHFTQVQKLTLEEARQAIEDPKLKDMIRYGVGFHHAGLLVSDRHNVEELFRSGFLPVLICTSTLAMGVNLPAHLVVIKSTSQYMNGSWEEYSEGQLLQMMGRAGRPQFDSHATAIILTKSSLKERYEKLMLGKELVESSLHKNLPEHLNSEIVLGTITDIAVALHWLRSTFFYVRALKNPRYYGIPDGLSLPELEVRLQALCMRELNALEKFELIKKTDFAYNVEPTENGKLMARLYITFETMKILMKIKGTEHFPELLDLLSNCHEFVDIKLRMNERTTLNLLNNNKHKDTIRFPLQGRIKSKDMKVNCLLQAVLGSLPISDPSLAQEANRVVRLAQRVTKAISLYLWQKNFYQALASSLILSKCLSARMWDNSIYVSRQLPGIGPAFASLLAAAKKVTFKAIIESNPRDLERILNKHPPIGNNLQEAAKSIPNYSMALDYSVFMKKVLVNIKLLNADYVHDPSRTVTLLVADSNNWLLYKEKLRDGLLIEHNGEHTLSIKIPVGTDYIIVHLISDALVGVDIRKKIVLSGNGSAEILRESSVEAFTCHEEYENSVYPETEITGNQKKRCESSTQKKLNPTQANRPKKSAKAEIKKTQTNLHQYAFKPLRTKKLLHSEEIDWSEAEVSSTQDNPMEGSLSSSVQNSAALASECTLHSSLSTDRTPCINCGVSKVRDLCDCKLTEFGCEGQSSGLESENNINTSIKSSTSLNVNEYTARSLEPSHTQCKNMKQQTSLNKTNLNTFQENDSYPPITHYNKITKGRKSIPSSINSGERTRLVSICDEVIRRNESLSTQKGSADSGLISEINYAKTIQSNGKNISANTIQREPLRMSPEEFSRTNQQPKKISMVEKHKKLMPLFMPLDKSTERMNENEEENKEISSGLPEKSPMKSEKSSHENIFSKKTVQNTTFEQEKSDAYNPALKLGILANKEDKELQPNDRRVASATIMRPSAEGVTTPVPKVGESCSAQYELKEPLKHTEDKLYHLKREDHPMTNNSRNKEDRPCDDNSESWGDIFPAREDDNVLSTSGDSWLDGGEERDDRPRKEDEKLGEVSMTSAKVDQPEQCSFEVDDLFSESPEAVNSGYNQRDIGEPDVRGSHQQQTFIPSSDKTRASEDTQRKTLKNVCQVLNPSCSQKNFHLSPTLMNTQNNYSKIYVNVPVTVCLTDKNMYENVSFQKSQLSSKLLRNDYGDPFAPIHPSMNSDKYDRKRTGRPSCEQIIEKQDPCLQSDYAQPETYQGKRKFVVYNSSENRTDTQGLIRSSFVEQSGNQLGLKDKTLLYNKTEVAGAPNICRAFSIRSNDLKGSFPVQKAVEFKHNYQPSYPSQNNVLIPSENGKEHFRFSQNRECIRRNVQNELFSQHQTGQFQIVGNCSNQDFETYKKSMLENDPFTPNRSKMSLKARGTSCGEVRGRQGARLSSLAFEGRPSTSRLAEPEQNDYYLSAMSQQGMAFRPAMQNQMMSCPQPTPFFSHPSQVTSSLNVYSQPQLLYRSNVFQCENYKNEIYQPVIQPVSQPPKLSLNTQEPQIFKPMPMSIVENKTPNFDEMYYEDRSDDLAHQEEFNFWGRSNRVHDMSPSPPLSGNSCEMVFNNEGSPNSMEEDNFIPSDRFMFNDMYGVNE